MEEIKKSPEESFLESAINVLRKDEIISIMENLPPISVVNLCQTNRKFARICNNQDLFKRLIIKHYPNVVVDLVDPKGQFIQLAGDEGTRYVVFYEPFEKREDILGNEIEIWNNYESVAYQSNKGDFTRTFLSFRIKGTVFLNKGTKIWLMDTANIYGFGEAEAFMTLEDAVNDFLERGFEELAEYWIQKYLDDDLDDPYFSDLDRNNLIAYMKGKIESTDLTVYFDNFTKGLAPVSPYNVANIREYIMENLFFVNDLKDQNDLTQYVQFTQVEIGGEYQAEESDYINKNF